MKLKVNPLRCPQDHRCPLIAICPAGAIEQRGFSLPEINEEKCKGCLLCARSCPRAAVMVEE
ncbi:MAG: 4Fe-4S binding protein [Archaeoglobi archaeon]|nr:4Fe-4S binding protein [Candidatus Mnemosynella bozhongmuii]